MYVLIPGRHHAMSAFHHRYLSALLRDGLREELDSEGEPLGIEEGVEALVYAVTSANHSGTRRNPLPFYLRALAINDFAQSLGARAFIFGIEDVGRIPDFAAHTLKTIRHQSEGDLDLNPRNCLVLCSTPVLDLYRELGFRVLPAELDILPKDGETPKDGIAQPGGEASIDGREPKDGARRYRAPLPFEIVERIAAAGRGWEGDPFVLAELHPSSREIFRRYSLPARIATIFSDSMIGDDGDITETRDYGSYVRQMDEIADLKYAETRRWIQPGRIGDIGCAVGSWIKRACADPRFRESDFYGVEVARRLYELCEQRKGNGEFPNPNVFFARKNAVSGLVYPEASMDAIHTGSLTHEIESYGGREDLIAFAANRLRELAPGGVWVNRDVVAPSGKSRKVLMLLEGSPKVMLDGSPPGGSQARPTPEGALSGGGQARPAPEVEPSGGGQAELAAFLGGLSTHGRFLRFARDFRAEEGFSLPWRERLISGETYVETELAYAMEFLCKKDYLDNWRSEMHETFCFFDFGEWKALLERTGFELEADSAAFVNEWIVEKRFKGKAALFAEGPEGGLEALPFPETHMVLIARRPR